MARTYFHRCPPDADPEQLLDPANQFSTPWGSADHGPCDKCGGEGSVVYECRSCIEEGARADCPACEGRVRFPATCPTCEGSGLIDNTRRSGVSVFPTRAGLYRYLAERGAGADGDRIVELEGELSEEPDLDADSGALLLRPTRIVEIGVLDGRVLGEIRERLAGPHV
jgi:hypothetical protein